MRLIDYLLDVIKNIFTIILDLIYCYQNNKKSKIQINDKYLNFIGKLASRYIYV